MGAEELYKSLSEGRDNFNSTYENTESSILNGDSYSVGNFKFKVQVYGFAEKGLEVSFKEVSGLESGIKVYEFQEGGYTGIHRFIERIQTGTLVLRRGIGNFNPLSKWYKETEEGRIVKLPITIMLLDERQKPVRTWNVEDAFPIKWIGPSLDAQGNQIAVEEVHFSYSGISNL
ncbi:phage tail protein [Defluviitalea saccharophila]|uniref:Phage tail protein n=1 Tax=Defluviitalea saccharophila TaxID=879970 RepID=A0ABZ2YAR6_9FIRM